ncbi:hypothetical protein RJT34_07930 [Clitoria ternatea]|uniref:DUF674 domain-containing protein n=1 Tax=Clitoria ternatea TaxID=43366 RepID=A0AAN9K6D9_CLITE
MATSSPKLTLKLLIDTKREKVLFAEASKPVIDFLFNLLCLPLSTVITLLNKNGMVGSIANLYQSVENLNDTYMQPNLHKNAILKPRASVSSAKISGLLPSIAGDADDNSQSTLYMCSRRCNYNVTFDNNNTCPQCDRVMNNEIRYVGAGVAQNNFSSKDGFVKEVVTYMVMDDLVIQPMSTISSITLLNKFNVKEIGALQEKLVDLGVAEGVNLLKASLQSKNVLTSVFYKSK